MRPGAHRCRRGAAGSTALVLGCDIRREHGNLLEEFGFRKTRPPTEVRGSTAYELSPWLGAGKT
ncbi:MAG: hypothetical protein FJ271_04015 [Planctomycetes bacterium]|nr:hypothetical protein [Planctomycetota bacterium]